MNNKEVKNIIDELALWYEQTIEGIVYVLSEIDWDYFTFDSTATKENFKVLDSSDLFDLIHEENLY